MMGMTTPEDAAGDGEGITQANLQAEMGRTSIIELITSIYHNAATHEPAAVR
jgi:hypothetical protein